MSKLGQLAKKSINAALATTQVSKLKFRRYDGYSLAQAAANFDSSKVKVESVTLKINPQEIAFSEPKITQKVQTSHPNRFIIFDWGTDLLSMNISGNTGNMLPSIIAEGYKDPFTSMAVELSELGGGAATVKARKQTTSALGSVNSFISDIVIGSMTYYEVLNMSTKYRTFEKLRMLYKKFDGDYDVLTLEMDEKVYRGYFMDFSFTMTADNPWNWKYTISFVALDDLTIALKIENSSYHGNIQAS